MDNQSWHQRFLVQADWTKELRRYLVQQLGITPQSRILETGCGTGVITAELQEFTNNKPVGIDIEHDRLTFAQRQFNFPSFACADVAHLPFLAAEFDAVVSHYFFLWLRDPAGALLEMLRVVKPGGFVVALAEPDYLARVDSPQELWKLGEMQTQSIIRQGANPMMGRLLPGLFAQAGMEHVQYGVSGFQAHAADLPVWWESEWQTLEQDLTPFASNQEIHRFKECDLAARRSGARILWVPTFYAFGIKNND